MRTLDDLRRSFEQHADLADDPRGLVQAAREGAARIRRRRRMIRAGASAAVVAVLAVAVPVVVTRNLAQEKQIPASPAGRHLDQLTVELNPASNFVITSATAGANRQEMSALPKGPRTQTPNLDPTVHIVVFDPGAYDVGSLPGTEPVTVAGHDAWFQPAFPLGRLGGPPTVDTRGPAIGWVDGSGAQVVVYRRPEPDIQKTMMLRVAEGLRIGPPRDVTVPFRIGWVPAGLAITGVTQRSEGSDTVVRLGRDDVEVRLWATPNLQFGSSGPERTELTVAGRPAFYIDDGKTSRLIIPKLGTCGLIIETTQQEPTTRADFIHIVETLKVADCNDRTTWTRLDR